MTAHTFPYLPETPNNLIKMVIIKMKNKDKHGC
jgi:hypothetical protein